MRYVNGIAVMLPWMDTDGNRNWSKFNFTGNVDRRRVRRMLRRSLGRLGISAPKFFIDFHIAHKSHELGS